MSSSSSSSSSQTFARPSVYSGGRQGAKPYQEDSYFSWCSSNNRVIVGGVLDGHGGYNGLMASNTARDTALNYLQKNEAACETWSEDEWTKRLNELFDILHNEIRDVFLKAPPNPPLQNFNNAKPPVAGEKRYTDDKGIVRNANADPIHGGTTASIVVMIQEDNGAAATLITANVGDSTALLIPTKGTWDFLSVDHGPENADEWGRVNASSESSQYETKLLFVYDKTNVFRKYECPCVFLPDGTKDQQYVANPWGYGLHPTNVRYEPAVYAVTPRNITKDSTCIAMTRALGDFYAHQFGLTHRPSITKHRMTLKEWGSVDTAHAHTIADATESQSFTVFLASDGVWDCWRYDDLMTFVNDLLTKKKKNLMEMGESVLEESIARAIANFGAKHYDDACLVTWQFIPKPASK